MSSLPLRLSRTFGFPSRLSRSGVGFLKKHAVLSVPASYQIGNQPQPCLYGTTNSRGSFFSIENRRKNYCWNLPRDISENVKTIRPLFLKQFNGQIVGKNLDSDFPFLSIFGTRTIHSTTFFHSSGKNSCKKSDCSIRFISRTSRQRNQQKKKEESDDEEEKKPKGLVQRFKYLWKRYWYIAIPVHLGTSAMWFGGFYYAAYSGLDVIGLLEQLNFMPENWLAKLKDKPQAGHIAVAYALYKLASPARYAVTIGGTHVSMRVLSNLGLIRTAKEVKTDVSDYIREKRIHYRTRRENRLRRLRMGFRRNNSHLHHHKKK